MTDKQQRWLAAVILFTICMGLLAMCFGGR